MEKKETQQGKVIGNVGTLDIRKATEESIASIRRIGNVSTLIYSPETAKFIPRLNMGNLGSSFEVPMDAKILSGQVVFSRDYFKNQTKPINLVVMGQLIVNPDVPEADIEKGLSDLRIMGQVIYPEHLVGAIESKIRHLQGQSQTYTQSSRIVMGQLILDEHYLRALENASELVVFGNLKLPQVLTTELLEQKIQRIQVFGKIVCHEENAPTILARLEHKSGTPKVTIIPTGYELVERPLILNADLLANLPGRKLFCSDQVQIDPKVDAAMLDKNLEAIIVKDLLLSPESLKSVLSRKINLLESENVIFYDGELWLVESDLTIRASRFNYVEGKATLVVLGDLTIASDVDPKLLFERLAKVHNFGDIICTPEQMSAIEARLGLNEGDLVDSTETEAEKEEAEEGIGNVGHLSL